MGVSEIRVLIMREPYYLGIYIRGSRIFVNPHIAGLGLGLLFKGSRAAGVRGLGLRVWGLQG